MRKAMTLNEFEQQYAKCSGVTVEWLHTHGRRGTPCNCEEPGCEDWQMEHVEPELKEKDDRE